MLDTDLTGRTVLAIVTNYGVHQGELIVPVEYLRDRGIEVTIAVASNEAIITLVGGPSPTHVGTDRPKWPAGRGPTACAPTPRSSGWCG